MKSQSPKSKDVVLAVIPEEQPVDEFLGQRKIDPELNYFLKEVHRRIESHYRNKVLKMQMRGIDVQVESEEEYSGN
jgi:hypothetical protein